MDFLRPAVREEARSGPGHRRPEYLLDLNRITDPTEGEAGEGGAETPGRTGDTRPALPAAGAEAEVDPKTAKARNRSFTDHLIPTLSSAPAVRAAIRDATGLEHDRTPVRPEHLTGAA